MYLHDFRDYYDFLKYVRKNPLETLIYHLDRNNEKYEFIRINKTRGSIYIDFREYDGEEALLELGDDVWLDEHVLGLVLEYELFDADFTKGEYSDEIKETTFRNLKKVLKKGNIGKIVDFVRAGGIIYIEDRYFICGSKYGLFGVRDMVDYHGEYWQTSEWTRTEKYEDIREKASDYNVEYDEYEFYAILSHITNLF